MRLTKKQRIAILSFIVLIFGVFFYWKVLKPKEIELTTEQKRKLSLEKLSEAENLFQKNDHSGTERFAQEAIDLDPENIKAYILLGQVKYVQGKTREARDVYLKGLEKDPKNFQINFNLANVYRDLGEYENSEKYYKIAIELNPEDPILWYNFAFLFYLQEKGDKINEICQKALEKFPENELLKSICQEIE